MQDEINFLNRYILTIQEAAVYFHIGENKIRDMAKQNPRASWILWNGTRYLIKRKKMEEFLDSINEI